MTCTLDETFVKQAVQAFLDWRTAAPGRSEVERSRRTVREMDVFLEALDDAMSQCEPLRGELFGE